MPARFIRSRWHGIGPLTKGGMTRAEYKAWCEQQAWSPAAANGLSIQTDLDPAAWIEPRLRPGTFDVSMTVPQGFEAYARILFPFVGDDTVTGGGIAGQQHVTWTETARRSGRVPHALMERETIVAPGADGDCSRELTDEQADALLPILARHTASERGWFLLWNGFGHLDQQAFERQPRVVHPMREFYLLRGALRAYRSLPDSPNYWWPDDRAWCLCTDTDFYWAYLAGSAACVSEVLAVPELDAYETSPGNPARSGMDVINDPDGTIPRRP
jgi:hypothetical protein